jgi:sortase A
VRRGLITGVLGRILLGGGVLILLFTAYQLWGTGIAESHSQAVLRQRFDALLHRIDHGQTSPSSTSTTSPSSTTTTGTGDQPTVGATLAAPNDGSPVGFLRIAKIRLDKVLVEGTSTNDLRQGPGHYSGTPLPGEKGNAAIAGHRTTYGAPFYNLDQLGAGDTIQVTTIQGAFTYRVTSKVVVSPDDMAVLANTTTPELTLTTCNPRFSASTRLVIHAALTTNPAPTLPATKHGSRSAATSDLAGSEGSWVPALEWGVLSAAVVAAVFVVARRRRGRAWRGGVYALGGAASLVALFFFFGALSPLLPASF